MGTLQRYQEIFPPVTSQISSSSTGTYAYLSSQLCKEKKETKKATYKLGPLAIT